MNKLQQVIAYAIKSYPKNKTFHLTFKLRLPVLFYMIDCIHAQKTKKTLTECEWVKAVMPFTPDIHNQIKDAMINPKVHEIIYWKPLLIERINPKEPTLHFPIYEFNTEHPFNKNVKITDRHTYTDIQFIESSRNILTDEEKQSIKDGVAICAASSAEQWIDAVFDSKPMKNALQNRPIDIELHYN